MKKIIPALLIALLAGTISSAQSQYQVFPDSKNGSHIYKGILSREALTGDSTFKWYADNQKGYTPNADGLNALKKNADSIQLLVFMGTWCEDSHFIIPKLYSLLDAASFPASHITLIGVDREKKTLSNLSDALNIKNVPTIIAYKNGVELGRVVEYGKYGMFDKELGEIINRAAPAQ